ncbi:hypothetical protein G4Z16_12990 [Streptomyces bathyalis]|uniref:Aromatic ring-opening dioxygenase LigA n=1 Tax=Streptomyces bathyalis TaxID=2710756 RepID=A0A7T1T6B0_9ACTN|nr:hypothetical protein [Streptomyces bathyalis]QPP07147.1 hypothetical protein G4Z16_12990 [Streptomyces bathyalis]
MQFFRPPYGQLRPTTAHRVAAVATCALLLATSVSACTSAQRLTTGMKVRNSVVKLGDQPAATVIVSVDGSPREAREFLTARAGGKHRASKQAAHMLAHAELTVSAGTDDEEEKTPLKEMPQSDAANVAAALNFGGKDVAAVKSVEDKLYLRASLRALVKHTVGSKDARETASEIVALADDLPPTMAAAEDALNGEWVRADAEAFDDFARVAVTLAERERDKQIQEDKKKEKERKKGKDEKGDKGKKDKREEKDHGSESDDARRSREIRDAVTIGSALDGQSQREFISGVQDLLRKHAEFEAKGERRGAEHVRMTLPGRAAAKDLVAALRPLGAEIDPARVPEGDIAGDLSIRRGQLTSLTLDLGQFTRGDAHLPLRLEFSSGDAVAVTAPGGTKELEPQDLMATWMYGALGTEKF